METDTNQSVVGEPEKRDVPKKLINLEGIDVDAKTLALMTACVDKMESSHSMSARMFRIVARA